MDLCPRSGWKFMPIKLSLMDVQVWMNNVEWEYVRMTDVLEILSRTHAIRGTNIKKNLLICFS